MRWLRTWGLRLLGIGLLVVLLARVDVAALRATFAAADHGLIGVSILLIVPLIFVKTLRWRVILRGQQVDYAVWPAFLAYFGSLFIGYLTPGRLGEFIKAIHVNRDCGIPAARAFSSVLSDRLFDLYALVIVGALALLQLAIDGAAVVTLIALLLLTLPLWLYLNPRTYAFFQGIGLKLGAPGRKFFAPDDGILTEIRAGLLQLSWAQLIGCIALTVIAYLIFFGECHLLALALGLPVDFPTTAFAIALGSLITLVPISISGVGTRDAAIISYLTTVGIAPALALSFSLLVFVAFYLAGGVIGAAAWLLKPVSLADARTAQSP